MTTDPHANAMTILRDWHAAQADKMPDREDHAEERDYLNFYLQALAADYARMGRA